MMSERQKQLFQKAKDYDNRLDNTRKHLVAIRAEITRLESVVDAQEIDANSAWRELRADLLANP